MKPKKESEKEYLNIKKTKNFLTRNVAKAVIKPSLIISIIPPYSSGSIFCTLFV
jgi:hypothetical protein